MNVITVKTNWEHGATIQIDSPEFEHPSCLDELNDILVKDGYELSIKNYYGEFNFKYLNNRWVLNKQWIRRI